MVQKVSFRYNETTPWIYKNLEFGMDLDTRLALVGPNGAGKSTLLKLIAGEVIDVNFYALVQYEFFCKIFTIQGYSTYKFFCSFTQQKE